MVGSLEEQNGLEADNEVSWMAPPTPWTLGCRHLELLRLPDLWWGSKRHPHKLLLPSG